MGQGQISFLMFLLFLSVECNAQRDSASAPKPFKPDTLLNNLQDLPYKYLNTIDNKIDKYTNRVTQKTEKTLTKLSRWETKIRELLKKASPETEKRLFGNNQLTFTVALEKYKQGEALFHEPKARFNDYRDKLTSSINYLDEQKEKIDEKLLKPLKKAKGKVKEYEQIQDQSDAMEQFIKERKKQLFDQALKVIGKSKYLGKVNKEAYYYAETLRNYKEIFSDKDKAEKTALTILNKIPAFQKFIKENSMLASLFRIPSNYGSLTNMGGLQTRSNVTAMMQSQLGTSGPNAMSQIAQNFQSAKNELYKLKDKVLKAGGGNSDTEMPDFKPNKQKSKTFKQRLEYGNNFQFGKTNSFMPTSADIGLNIGYKLNDKSVIGIGASYKMGLGSIQRIRITHEGVGMRTYMDWKLKKQFYVSGGFEMNYNAQFKNLQQLQQYNDWQQSGLIGLSKKLNINTKWFKGSKMQLLYDMLAYRHKPSSQQWIFRMGYSFSK